MMEGIFIIVMMMMMCCIVSSQVQFVKMEEKDTVGKVYGNFSFDCTNNVNWNVTNFPNVFQVDKISNSKINVYLKNSFSRSHFTTHTVDCKEIAKQISIHVSCSKGSNKAELTVQSFLLEDRSAPYLCDSNCTRIDSPHTILVPENTTVGTNVAAWSICDDIIYGSNIPQYSETISPKNAIIEYTTQGLILKRPLDYETNNNNFNVNITIETVSGGSENSTLELNVQVKDVDDLGLAFGKNMYECNIPENTVDVPNCTVQANDLDTQVNAHVNYELISESSMAKGVFVVNKSSGLITVNTPLDRETVSVIVLYIKGYQVDHPHDKVNYTTVIINVTDEDDHAPNMTETNISIDITENIPIGTIVCQVMAEDTFDQGDNAKFVYEMTPLSTLFVVNDLTGLVTTHMTIDREALSNTSVNLQIKAISVVNKALASDPANVRITVLDENDNSPVFYTNGTGSIMDIDITKTQILHDCIVTINATDKDSGENGLVKYSMEQDLHAFAIDPSSGCISLNTNISESFSFLYRLVIKAEDQAKQFKRSSTLIVQVHVQDVNTHSPVFVNLSSSINISEAIPPNTMILELKAKDADPTDNLTFILQTHQDVFEISQDILMTKVSLDRENVSSYSINLAVTDSEHEVQKTVEINVEDVNDNAPLFANETYLFEVNESTDAQPGPKLIEFVLANDIDSGDNGKVTYQIESSQWNGNVSIDQTTGFLSVNNLDRDVMGNDDDIQLTVLAVDAGTPQRTGITMVTIHVVGVNDNKPIYPDINKNVTLYIREGVTDSSLYKSQAYDADIGVGSEIHYTLTNNPDNSFSINPLTGVLSVNKSLHITSSNKGVTYLQVLAQNDDGNQSDEQNITVFIQDINDHIPEFDQNMYNETIEECIPRDEPILSVHATDADFTTEFNTVYYWIEQPWNSTFFIDSNSGSIYVIGNIDYDNPNNSRDFSFQVFGSDLGPTKAENVSTHVILHITNCNDNPPVFTKGLYQCSVTENRKGSFDCQVTATDLDSDASQTALNYSIASSDSTNLIINNNNGEVTVQSPYNYEAMVNHTVHLNVSAYDGKFKSYAEVIVEVLNANDVAPVIDTKPSAYEVFENITYPYFIDWINVTDADSSFEISFLTCQDVFHIDVNGNVFAKSALDYEDTKTNYTCQLTATDTVSYTNATMTIHIKNVNDNYPIFDQPIYNRSLHENQADIIKVNASDGDLDEVTYSIDPDSVWIQNVSMHSSTGEIVLKPLDRDVMDNSAIIAFTVFAVDNGKPQRTGSVMVTVTVLGVNDNDPFYPSYLKHVQLYIPEGRPRPSVYTSKADDADIGVGSEIRYAIKDDKTGAFGISNSSGVISSKTLDITSTQTRFTFEVEAYNVNGSQNATQMCHVYIVAANHHSPEFNETYYKETLAECSKMNAEILRVHATDADSTKQYNTVYYWMEQTNNDYFNVDMFTGAIHLVGAIDYDKTERDISLTVYATDDVTSRNKNNDAHVNVTLTITDCNDNPPIFAQSLYMCNIDEGETGEFGCRVQATDIDDISTIQYSIIDQDKIFSIDDLIGNISVKSKFDFESMRTNPVFVNVSASDGNFTRYTEVVVFVKDVNDESPVFNNMPYKFSTAENNLIPHYIGSVNVTDTDSAITTLSVLNCSDAFYLTKSGDLFSNTSLDYETETKYICRIEASDGKNSVLENVAIYIQDTNDNPPIFKNNTYNISLNETFPTNKRFITVTATDDDQSGENNNVTYSIFAGNVYNVLSINPINGSILLVNSLDQLGGDVLEVTIKATDNGNPPLTAYTTVTVNVTATNNHAPKFVRTPYHALIYENVGNQSIFQVSAEDMDGTQNLIFIVTNNTDFYFDTNGTLIAKTLDAEKYNQSKGVCYINVTVSDGIYADNVTAKITIIDQNDNPPLFDETGYTKTIKDTTDAQAEILNVTAFDEDITNDGFTFILRNSEGDFDINSTTGQVYLQRPLGQNGKEYKMVVEVIDSGTPPKHNETNITITIEDTNNAPTFDDRVTYQTVNENDGTLNLSIAAIDTDLGQAGNVTYFLSAPNDDLNMFKFDTLTAILTLSNSSCPLDFETHPIYHITITAEDHGVFPKSFSANITINVTDINEAPYIVSNSGSVVYVEFNTPINTQILNITADDPDVNNNGFNQLTYSLAGNGNTSFDVHPNGTVYSKKDISESGNYSISVTVTDNGNLPVTKQFTIIVPGIANITEHVNVSENVVHTNLTLLNKTVNGYELVFEIQPSAHYGMFAITSNNDLSLVNAFDRETTAKTLLWIYGRSIDHANILLANITVNITIDDENDCAPEFKSNEYIMVIDDVMETNSLIGGVHAVDDDVDPLNREVSYSLLNYTDGYFRIEKTGEIFLGDVPSMQPQNITLTVIADDGNYETNTTVMIRVLDTNNHSPQFNVSKLEVDMVEFNCTDTPCKVGTLLATDSDLGNNGNISYTIIAGSHSLFVVSLQGDGSGLIEAVANIDREENEQLTLTVCASDMGHWPRQSCVSAVINVLDVNDNPPMFHEADAYIASVVENSGNYSTIEVTPNIVALDIDKDKNGTEGLTYSLNVTDGPICMSKHYPVSVYICGITDRETQDVYYLSVEVHDIGNMSASLPLTVYIKDDNDESPVFTEPLYTFNVTENANISEYVGKVSVTDRDINGTADITYTIQKNNASPIYIDGITGALYVGGQIDREKDVYYVLNISAFDGRNFNYTTVGISVEDVNDNAPDFGLPEREIITINVTENIQYGVIRNLTVADKDEEGSVNSEVVFRLDGGNIVLPSSNHTIVCDDSGVAPIDDSCLFTITQTGQLNLTRTLDREIQEHYLLTITASDRGETPLSSSITVYINVLDQNDNDPVFIVDGNGNTTYSESHTIEKVPENSVLKLIDANDKDFGINGTVSYSIIESPFSEYFNIGKNSGVVSINKPIVVNTLLNIRSVDAGIIDSNETAILNLTISATDGGGRSTNMTLCVFIEPLNDDDAPAFKEMVFNFTIPENEPDGFYVGTCLARIVNETYSHMTYSLVSGYELQRNDFNMDSKTGVITTRVPLDRENVAQYTFAVKVRDGRIPERTAFAVVEIQVSDVNDNSPLFLNKDMMVEFPENSPPHVINVTAYDQDLGQNGRIGYSLVDDFAGMFMINNTTGIVNASGPFDFEDENQYRVEIVASDFGLPFRMNSSVFINVSITDENDNMPYFVDNITSIDITENSPPQKVFSVIADDNDSGWNGHIIYELINKKLTPFVINALSGDVYLRGHIDFEQKANYTLKFQAKDQGQPPLFASKTVHVNVIDVYDDFPKFESETYEVTVSSTQAVVGASLIELDAGVTDVDFGISGQDASYFKVIGHNLTLGKNLNPDRNIFVVTVTAKDRLNQTTSCSVIVHTRGHTILFPQKDFPVSVVENLKTGSILVDLNTTEEFLPGRSIVYTIESVVPSESGVFTVDSSTGEVRCNKALDRETVSQYIITVSARSPETRRRRDVQGVSSLIRIIVNVTDVNDNPPRFSESQQHVFGVPDNARANYIVTTLKAFDPDVNDAGNLRYNLTAGHSSVFGVDKRTGKIITLVAIASVKESVLRLTVTAYDKEKKDDKAVIDVVINVVRTENQPYLILDKSVANFIAKKSEMIKNMSRILGVEIQTDKIEGHVGGGGDNLIHVDLSKTDFHFHGFHNSSGSLTLVSNAEMERLLRNASNELAGTFGSKPEIRSYHESQDPIFDPSAITSTQILLICMAVFIFFGTGSALLIALYSSSRYDDDCQMEEVNKEEHEGFDIELSTLRSRQSSKMSSITAAAAFNPQYQETEIGNRTEEPNESQEIRMNFGEELRMNRGFDVPSGVDSGVGNTSVHSATNHTGVSINIAHSVEPDEIDIEQPVDGLLALGGHGPVMTSSPKPSRPLTIGGSSSIVDDHEADKPVPSSPKVVRFNTSNSNIVIFNTTTTSETDDDFDGDEEQPKEGVEDSADTRSEDDDGPNFSDTSARKADTENEDIDGQTDQDEHVESTSF